jgi:hypothetical protein
MADIYGIKERFNLPFDVREDQYTGDVRLSYQDYNQAIDRETWYRAKSERGMMDRLIENFMEQYRRLEASRRKQMSAYAMNPLREAKQIIAPTPGPNREPKPNKTLLLCDV